MTEKQITEYVGLSFILVALILIIGCHIRYCTTYAIEGPPIWFSFLVLFFTISGFIITSLVHYGVRK